MMGFGKRLNPHWDSPMAHDYLAELNIPLGSMVGDLSVGQQAQVALAMCLAKRPSLLLLDEPVAALDPVAREELMQVLLRSVADKGTTVLLSTHSLSELSSVCDYVIILSASRVYVADDLDFVLASHRILVASAERPPALPPGISVVSAKDSERQKTLLVRVEEPVTDPAWRIVEPTLEEIVVGYLRIGRQEVGESLREFLGDVEAS
jgi:ABC-2 type transport system ATP-binding protein